MPTTAYRLCSSRSFPPPLLAWPFNREPTHVPAVPVNMTGMILAGDDLVADADSNVDADSDVDVDVDVVDTIEWATVSFLKYKVKHTCPLVDHLHSSYLVRDGVP